MGSAIPEKAIHEMALEAAKDPNPKRVERALGRLVRLAALRLQSEALLGWAHRAGLPRFLHDALPSGIRRHLEALGVRFGFTGEATAEVDLATTPVLAFPWKDIRFLNALLLIGNWRYDPDNHCLCLYHPLGLAVFYNGMHSGAVGVLERRGRLPASEADLGPAYQAGLRVEWVGETPYAVVRQVREPFAHPGYALLWALGQVLWERGMRLS